MAIVLLILFLIFILLGTPMGYAMGALTYSAFFLLGGDYSIIAQKMFAGIDTYTYVCILLFILATDIMSIGGITRSIVDFCDTLVGHIKGGLAHVNILASMLFAGLSGSAIADISGLGPLEVKLMEEGGYDRDYSAAVTAASSIIGPIIPPSNVMIIYAGCAASVSVGKMFLGGVLPGIMLGLVFMCLAYYYAVKFNMPHRETKATFKQILKSLWRTLPALLLPIIIMGSIVSGLCTATESSCLAVLYAIIIAIAYRKLTFKNFFRSCIRSAKSTANVLFIIAISSAMGWAITTLQIPQTVTRFCLEIISSKALFLLFVNIFLLVLGMLMDASPAILMMVPILLPVSRAYGINDIHFGVMVCLNLMIGMLTPPVGMSLFVTSNVVQVKLATLFKRIWPFVLVAMIVLILVTYVPAISMFLPNLLKK